MSFIHSYNPFTLVNNVPLNNTTQTVCQQSMKRLGIGMGINTSDHRSFNNTSNTNNSLFSNSNAPFLYDTSLAQAAFVENSGCILKGDDEEIKEMIEFC